MATTDMLDDSPRADTCNGRARAPAVAQPAELQCRTLTRISDWPEVQPWWDELLAQSDDATPWQSWDYLSRWWEHLRADRELRLIVVSRAGRPVLAMPLQISRRFEMLGMPVRMLEPVGMIMDVNRPRIAIGAFDEAAYRCAFDALWQRRREWDMIRVDEKCVDDAEVGLLRSFAVEHGLWYRDIFSHLCPRLDLQQDWGRYLGSRSRRLRKGLRASRRRLEAIGRVDLRSFATPAEVEQGYEHVLALHRVSWKARKGVEQSQSASYREFYREWLQALARRGGVRILVLFCDSIPVAATIAILDGDRYFAAQIVHDARYDAASPGTLLEAMEIEGLMREGRFREYDFLGGFLNNKLRWTEDARATSLIFAFQPCLRSAVIDAYYFRAKPWIKATLRRLRGAATPSSGT